MPGRRGVLALVLALCLTVCVQLPWAIRRTADEADETFEVGDRVLITSGKYKLCSGEVLELRAEKEKAKVLRSCNGSTQSGAWWYSFGQIEALEEEEPASEELGKEPDNTPASRDFEVIQDTEYLQRHPLCDRYRDQAPVNAKATPPRLAGRVVVRRGQTFLVRARGTVHADHAAMVFLASKPGVESETVIGRPGIIEDGSIRLEVPADAPVGEYELRLVVGDHQATALGFIVIFNPFTCRQCPESAGRRRKLKAEFIAEYVGGEQGLLWQGLSDDYGANVWQHDPFRAANLLISLSLLADLPLELRSDSSAIARHLTYAIGERVCYGKWGEGNYATGRPYRGYRCRTKKYLQRKGKANEWSKICSDPSSWTSSSPILEQHWGLVQSGSKATSVQYCQCFVFSGVMTTIGRALGIATRSVTNFQSAHDTNADRGISKFFFAASDGAWSPAECPEDLCPAWCLSQAKAAEKGCQLTSCKKQLSTGRGFTGMCASCMPCVPCSSNSDSVWSFHVWNEMYFARTEPGADGWQAVDATPQEESGGRFQMGPAAVKQVKQGTSDCFDTDFVIGEVNGDVKLFVYSVPDFSDTAKEEAAANGRFVLHMGDPLYSGIRWYSDPFGDIFNTIGFKAITKEPGAISAACLADPTQCQEEELDLTPFYKKCPNPLRRGASCRAGPARSKAQCREPGASSNSSSFLESGATEGEAEGRDMARQLQELSDVQDVTVDFSSFLPGGSIVMERDLPLKLSFRNSGSQRRTIRFLVSATGCDYRGRPVVHMETRRKKYAMRLPLEGRETLMQRELELAPGGEYTFQHTVAAANLDADLLSSLEINAADGTFFLQFHVSALVVETGQRFAHEPRRRLAERQ
ncbi:TGM3 [Symbiodinium sp. KB8]|nr:TGM3 [Symbiodinium sp. KB8]